MPASGKIVSVFEPHTDIIVKDSRDTLYGHKLCLTGGASNLIVDCVIVDGNPADTTLTDQMLDRQHELYGRYPLKVALEGGPRYLLAQEVLWVMSLHLERLSILQELCLAINCISELVDPCQEGDSMT